MRIQSFIIPIILLSMIHVGCGTPVKSRSDAELLAADFAFAAMSEAHGPVAAFDAYLDDDAIQLPHGAEPIFGRDDIVREMAEGPPFTLLWTPVKAEVARSGELGYTWGTYVAESKDADGKIQRRQGKYTNVWRKQDDGSWKVILDMGNHTPESRSPQ
ncbi:MAG: DUF4440 domain-containing protein [Ignavibacteria bacterium]|nr:DUF4440 domain-containing protein [Ignavibacteria bacterium]